MNNATDFKDPQGNEASHNNSQSCFTNFSTLILTSRQSNIACTKGLLASRFRR